MTVVVTGASGHLGAALVQRLAGSGTRTRAVVHLNRGPIEGLDVEVAEADVLDPVSLLRAFDGADIVYHLAGVISISGDPSGRVEAVNVVGARNAAEAALECGVRRFVHCSSIHAFDMKRPGQPGMIDEASPRVPPGSTHHSAYDRSKADGERAVREAVSRGLDAVVVHPTSVIGPHDHEPSRMGRFFRGLRDRRIPALVRGGFDFVDVRDVVEGMISAAERGERGKSYLLGGRYATVREVAEMAAAVTGVPAPRMTLPVSVARVGLPFIRAFAGIADGEPLYTSESLDILGLSSAIDHGRAQRELGYAVRNLEETVADIYEWFGDIG